MKQLLKRFLSVTLAIAVIAVCFVFVPTSSAATTGNIAIEATSENVQPGDTFTVDINITSNPGIVSLRLFVEYDTEVLTLVGAEDKGLLGTSQFTDTYGSPFRLVWSNGTATANYTVTGTIATLTFKASENIEKTASTAITVSTQSTNDILSVDTSTLDLIPVTPSFTNSTVNILPFRFSNISLTMYDNIGINFKVRQELFTELGYSDPYVVFEFNGNEYTQTTYTTSGNQYSFSFNEIGPKQLNDTITATLYADKDGIEQAAVPMEFSATTYCYGMLPLCTSDSYAELRTLLVDLLNFGTSVQNYTGYNLDNLANANLTEEQKAWGTADTPELASDKNSSYKTIDDPSVTWTGVGLYLYDTVEMRFKIATDDITGLKAKVVSAKTEKVWYIDSSDFKSTTGGYYIYFDGFEAIQMREVIYITIMNGDTEVSNTFRYDIESYAYDAQNLTDSAYDSLKDVTSAMMKYGDSAYNFAN